MSHLEICFRKGNSGEDDDDAISPHTQSNNDAKEKEGDFPPLLASMFSILMQASEGGKTTNKGREISGMR